MTTRSSLGLSTQCCVHTHFSLSARTIRGEPLRTSLRVTLTTVLRSRRMGAEALFFKPLDDPIRQTVSPDSEPVKRTEMTLQSKLDDAIYSPLADDPDLSELVGLFVEELPHRVDALSGQFEAGDWYGLEQTAHKLFETRRQRRDLAETVTSVAPATSSMKWKDR